MSEHEWLVVGAAVASVTRVRGQFESVRTAKVDRVGKRDVVLDTGERFPVRNLTRREGDSWSGRDARLVAADDPVVGKAFVEIRQRRLIADARQACVNFSHAGSVRGTTLTAADVILALAPLTGVADEIAALFAAAHQSTPTTESKGS